MDDHPQAGITRNLQLDKRAASLSDVVRAASAAHGVTLVVAPEGLPTKKTADLMGVSEAFLAKQRRAGEGPAYIKLSPTLIRYRPEDILSWLESRRVTHESRPDKRKTAANPSAIPKA